MYWPLQQQGSTGENVRTVQYLLNAQGSTLTVDGAFGPLTTAAVSAFQSSHGLVADGIVGDATWPTLLVQVASGSSGDAVRAVQSQLNARSGQVTVDGVFGPETLRAVQMLRGPIGLASDGVVNWNTWHAMVSGYLTSLDAGTCMQSVFDAWTNDDQAGAAYNSTPGALSALFARPWNAADGWTFDKCGVAAGHAFCTWNRTGGKLVLGAPDPGGGLYIYVDSAVFS